MRTATTGILLTAIGSLLLGLGSACGGNKTEANEAGGAASTTPAPQVDAMAEETPEQKFARQRADTVDKMCERLVDCSIADAQASMSEEELAQLDVEATSKQAHEECSASYQKLSPRQVVVVRECLGEPTECPDFGGCLAKLAGPSATQTP